MQSRKEARCPSLLLSPDGLHLGPLNPHGGPFLQTCRSGIGVGTEHHGGPRPSGSVKMDQGMKVYIDQHVTIDDEKVLSLKKWLTSFDAPSRS